MVTVLWVQDLCNKNNQNIYAIFDYWSKRCYQHFPFSFTKGDLTTWVNVICGRTRITESSVICCGSDDASSDPIGNRSKDLFRKIIFVTKFNKYEVLETNKRFFSFSQPAWSSDFLSEPSLNVKQRITIICCCFIIPNYLKLISWRLFLTD